MVAVDVGTFVMWMAVSLVLGLALLALAVGCGYATAAINRSKGRSARAGFWWGFAVPIVGMAVAAVLPQRADTASAEWGPTRTVLTRLAIGVGAAAIVVPAAGVIAYTQLVNDPDPKFDTNDLADLVGSGSTSSTSTGVLALNATVFTSASDTEPVDSDGAAADCAATTSSDAPADTASADSDAPGGLDGEWTVTDASEFGYRVDEVLAGVDTTATGRGSEIEGSLTVAGREVTDVCLVVQVASITSDENMRDNAFNSRIMDTGEYPTATFVLTEPIVLDELPEVGGDAITTEATGELTMHGVTNTVTFVVTAQAGDDVIGILGEIPITFADYGIDNPSGGPAQVGDDGTLEFLLQFEPAS